VLENRHKFMQRIYYQIHVDVSTKQLIMLFSFHSVVGWEGVKKVTYLRKRVRSVEEGRG